MGTRILRNIEREKTRTRNRRKGKAWQTTYYKWWKKHQNKDAEKYKEIKKDIQKQVRRAKEQGMNERCEEMEVLERRNDHSSNQRSKSNRKSNSCALPDDSIRAVVNIEDLGVFNYPLWSLLTLKIHWKSYIKRLFNLNWPETWTAFPKKIKQ